MKNSNLESGVVMNLSIVKFRKVKANEFSQYRGKVSLVFGFTIGTEEHSIEIDATVSALAGYWFYTNPERYVGKTFSSRNTSPDSHENPFCLVKSDNKYFLYMVWEGGKKYIDVVMPGGIVAKTIKPIYKSRENFVRFLDADALRKSKSGEAISGDLRHKQGSGGYSIPQSNINPNIVRPASLDEAFNANAETERKLIQDEINRRAKQIEDLGFGYIPNEDFNDKGYYLRGKNTITIYQIQNLNLEEWNILINTL